MPKQHWMVSLVRIVTLIFVIIGGFLLFWYSPFYSTLVVKSLNTFVSVEVDQVAAKSQQEAALSEAEGLEPGSELWIARQAYLQVMEKEILNNNTESLSLILERYKILQNKIEEETDSVDDEPKPQIPLLTKSGLDNELVTVLDENQTANQVNLNIISQSDHSIDLKENSSPDQAKLNAEQSQSEKLKVTDPTVTKQVSRFDLIQFDTAENQALMDKFIDFLMHYPVSVGNENLIDHQVYKDIAYIQKQNLDTKKSTSKPYAIVILGGGLTLADNKVDIIVNDYTRLRLEKTLEIEKKTKLPIVLSGVESSYMQAWLKERGVNATLLENRSMNTCENTRFSSLLLQKKGGAPTVLLITDRYHMPRTRRLFALNGIETIPVEAPMPTPLTSWQPSKTNYDHSRRANYEMLATIRDILFDSGGCREVP